MSALPCLSGVDPRAAATRLRGLTLLVVMCGATILVLDGLDIQVIGIAAPDLVRDLGIERTALAPALAASLLGMAFGAAGVGALGDRWGRKPTLLLSTLVFGVATLLAATSGSVLELAMWRLLTGIGLGGALPTATALMAEFTSGRLRAQVICTAHVGVPLGGILGALLAGEIVPDYGWRAMFVAGGVLPILAAAVMYFVMPESSGFLVARTTERRGGVRAIFGRDLRWDTIATSFAFLTNIFAVYAFFNWTPLVLTSAGFGFDVAVRSALAFNIAGIVGSLGMAAMLARWGSRFPLAASAALAALVLAVLASLPLGRSVLLLAGIAIAGATLCAVQVGMYALSAHVFPTACRSSGIGFALGAGRLGGIFSSFAGGWLLAQAGAAGFFGGVGTVMVLTLMAVLLLQRHILRPQD